MKLSLIVAFSDSKNGCSKQLTSNIINNTICNPYGGALNALTKYNSEIIQKNKTNGLKLPSVSFLPLDEAKIFWQYTKMIVPTCTCKYIPFSITEPI